mgnify:FL=1
MLEYIAQMVSNDNPQIQSHDVFDALIEREKLGSTGIGHGVALPHCRLKMIESAMAVLVLLENSFDYGSLDKQPVDIVVAVLVPEEATEMHLELLSMLAKKLSNPLVREQIRHASDKETLFKFATA